MQGLRSALCVVAAFIVIACILISFFSLRPTERTLELGNRSLFLSKKTQYYLRLVESSEKKNGPNIVIVEEPHYDITAQRSVYEGLTSLLAENPNIVAHSVFLAEGLEWGSALSVADLVAVAPDPLPENVRNVLHSLLIPAYVAHEWCHETDIPILGIEDPDLYAISAQLWAEKNYGELWLLTVTARNRSMAETAQFMVAQGKVVFLFIGGRHLRGLNQHTYLSAKQHLAFVKDPHLAEKLSTAKNWGVIDYLQEKGIGYHFLVGTSVGENTLAEEAKGRYRALFQAQASGDYSTYIANYVNGLLSDGKQGVTIRPAPQAAAQLLLALNAVSGGTQDANKGNDDQGQKLKKKKESFWDKLKNWRQGIKTNGKSGKNRRYYHKDRTHGDLEGYDRHGRHLGSFDPQTGIRTKPPVKGRVLDI